MKTEKELKLNMKNPYILYTFIFIHVDCKVTLHSCLDSRITFISSHPIHD